ncbi:MAG: TlpA family protein disulfide reductase [Acidobacteriota bacterium]|nr:TlpA family protein disulfide reductase [Acidobacteriota bacterium]
MTRKTFGLAVVLAVVFILAPAVARAQGGHEYAPIEEKTINYKDWTFKDLKTGEPFNLRKWTADKKLVLVVYFAPWCKNWKYEAPVLAKLYEKYKPHGLEVVAVSEYATLDEARKFFGDKGIPYPVVVESDSQDARTKTTHYVYRQSSGDKRNWGSPYNVFLEPASLKTEGDILTEKTWIVGGELIEKEAEQFIQKRLGVETKESTESGKSPQ